MKQKVIIFGLDGGTWKVLKPFIEKGELPAFKGLMERGVSGTLLSTVPCRSGTAIATFYTGKNPGNWGMMDFPCFDPDIITYTKIKEKALSVWDILGEQGYKSAILNIPATNPPTPTQGVMISGFSPSEEEEYTFPKDFKQKVKGFHSQRQIFFNLAYGKIIMKNKRERLNFLIKNAKERYELIKDIIKDETFDFSIFWLDESDSAQHVFWNEEGFLLTFFREIDNILKDIIEKNPNSNIIVISDHGFDARPTHDFYPKAWLRKEGYLKLRGSRLQQWLVQKINDFIISVPPRSKYIPRYKLIKWLYSFLNKTKSRSEGNKTDSPRQNWREVTESRPNSRAINIDWGKTRATNHDFWGIRIIRENLDGDYEKVREEIMGKMEQLKDKTGQKIIKNVWKREELYKGPGLQKFPDIVYLPISKFEPTGFLPSSVSKKKRSPKGGGDHLVIREGIFLAAGPDIKKTGEIGTVNMVDIAPTVLEIFRLPAPKDMDGRALKEIL